MLLNITNTDEKSSNIFHFAANNTGGNTYISNGLFKLNPFAQQESFMDAQYGGQGETYYYGNQTLKLLHYCRPKKVMSPVDSWIGASGGGRSGI